jgi:ketosteroid isomerase-like protein
MINNNMALAKAFYTAMGEKGITYIGEHVHPKIEFVSPLGNALGKEAYLKSVEHFLTLLQSLKIRTICGADEHVVLVYDVHFPGQLGTVPTASLMSFRDGLITRIELFYDARPFEKK